MIYIYQYIFVYYVLSHYLIIIRWKCIKKICFDKRIKSIDFLPVTFFLITFTFPLSPFHYIIDVNNNKERRKTQTKQARTEELVHISQTIKTLAFHLIKLTRLVASPESRVHRVRLIISIKIVY